MAPHRCSLIAAGIVAFLTLGGCSSAPSPKDELIESVDEKCRAITEQVAQDQSRRADKVGRRSTLVKELDTQVRDMPVPDADRNALYGWLGTLREFTRAMDELEKTLRNAQPGSEMLVALQTNRVKEKAAAIGPVATWFGFEDCAQVDSWAEFS